MPSFSFPELSLTLFGNSQIFISNSSHWRDNVVPNGATWNSEMTIVLIQHHRTKTIGVVSVRKKYRHHATPLSPVFSSWEYVVRGFCLSLIPDNFLNIFKDTRPPKIHLLLLLLQEQLKGFNMISGSHVPFSVKAFQPSLSTLCLLA